MKLVKIHISQMEISTSKPKLSKFKPNCLLMAWKPEVTENQVKCCYQNDCNC